MCQLWELLTPRWIRNLSVGSHQVYRSYVLGAKVRPPNNWQKSPRSIVVHSASFVNFSHVLGACTYRQNVGKNSPRSIVHESSTSFVNPRVKGLLRATVQQQKPAAKPPWSNSSLGRQLITLGTRLQQMPQSSLVSSVLDRQSITFECTEFKNQKHSGRHPEKWTVRYFNIQSVGAPNGQHQAPALHSFTSNSLPSSVGVIYSPFGNLYQPRSLLCKCGNQS